MGYSSLTDKHISFPFSNPISIHAPAKGATMGTLHFQNSILFQSTLPRRERHSIHQGCENRRHFNPRSREGSDKDSLKICSMLKYFNPRSREGSDLNAFNGQAYGSISIHAPAKGATMVTSKMDLKMYFNPRSREGSDIA